MPDNILLYTDMSPSSRYISLCTFQEVSSAMRRVNGSCFGMAQVLVGADDGSQADEEGDLAKVCEEGYVLVLGAVGVVGKVVIDLGGDL
jgi:hypothetical protein